MAETTSMTPFISEINNERSPGQRGYRALVSVGNLDTEISGLTSINPRYSIAGAGGDITVVNTGDEADGLRVGDFIQFRPDCAAFLRLMDGNYIDKVVSPTIADFRREHKPDFFEVAPVVW